MSSGTVSFGGTDPYILMKIGQCHDVTWHDNCYLTQKCCELFTAPSDPHTAAWGWDPG